MRSVNKVILIGNLTRDPELKTTTGGQSIVTFGLATNRQWTTSGSEKRNSAEFHECVAWAKLAEICNDYLKKGMLVYVEGYLKTRSWDMEDGTRRFRTEVVLQDMIILEKRRGEGEGDYAPAEGAETSGTSKGDDSSKGDDDDDDAATTDEAAAATPAVEKPAAEKTDTPVEAAPAAPVEAPVSATGLNANIDDDNLF